MSAVAAVYDCAVALAIGIVVVLAWGIATLHYPRRVTWNEERITFAAQVPHTLLAGLDDAWVRVDDEDERSTTLRRERARLAASLAPVLGAPEAECADTGEPGADEARVECYCEYFRRELAEVDTVEAMLALIGADG